MVFRAGAGASHMLCALNSSRLRTPSSATCSGLARPTTLQPAASEPPGGETAASVRPSSASSFLASCSVRRSASGTSSPAAGPSMAMLYLAGSLASRRIAVAETRRCRGGQLVAGWRIRGRQAGGCCPLQGGWQRRRQRRRPLAVALRRREEHQAQCDGGRRAGPLLFRALDEALPADAAHDRFQRLSTTDAQVTQKDFVRCSQQMTARANMQRQQLLAGEASQTWSCTNALKARSSRQEGKSCCTLGSSSRAASRQTVAAPVVSRVDNSSISCLNLACASAFVRGLHSMGKRKELESLGSVLLMRACSTRRQPRTEGMQMHLHRVDQAHMLADWKQPASGACDPQTVGFRSPESACWSISQGSC